MDSGYRSPFIDLFRRGEVDTATRMVGAQGALGLRAHEQLALLMMLTDDPEPDVAREAETTLALLPLPALSTFLARPEVSDVMRAFFAARGVNAAAVPPEDTGDDLDAPLLDAPLLDTPDEAPGEPEAAKEGGGSAAVLSTLPIIDRIKLATKGSREQRAQLIRDSNRMVSTAVLSSPKVNESEIEAFAKMANVSEDVLRIIGANRTWMKNYGIAHGLARNPKTPPGISMQLLHRLSVRDVKAVTTDRNVPEMVRLAARRLMSRAQK
jgi:hypothetical protein